MGGSNNNSSQQQQQKQGSSGGGPVIEVNTTGNQGNDQQHHQPTVGSAMHKFGKNMRKIGRSLSPKANRPKDAGPQKTAFFDADGNKQYVTETKKKQSRSININY